MNIELNITSTVYEDAEKQLLKHGKTIAEKLEDILEAYALEYRKLQIKQDVESEIKTRINKNDLRENLLGDQQ